MKIALEYTLLPASYDRESGGDHNAEVEHVMAQSRTWLTQHVGPRRAGETTILRDLNGNTIGRIEVRP